LEHRVRSDPVGLARFAYAEALHEHGLVVPHHRDSDTGNARPTHGCSHDPGQLVERGVQLLLRDDRR